MSGQPQVRYGFLPFLRTGLATRLTAPTLAAGTPRASISVAVTASQARDDNQNATHDVQNTVYLRGPGDIVAFDKRVVLRTDPKPGVGDFEANYFPTVDFVAPDFAWRYTPVAETGQKLRPWVALVVLKESEFTASGPGDGQTLDTITVKSGNLTLDQFLPNLDEAWAWAHVQVTDALDDATIIDFGSASDLRELLETHPELAISRVVCPRRLEDNTGYAGFLVPTFEGGRRAGLGMATEDTRGDELAWQGNATEVELPVFFRWDFRTGARGDFEYLVRALQPYPIPGSVGLREVDVGHPGPMVPAISNPADRDEPTLGFQGALQSLDTEPTPWPDPARAQPDPFQARLTALLNATADDPNDDPFVMPPIYGRWHAAVTRVAAAGPAWIDGLNLDPRNRGAAALGTQVVQAQQEPLMASAWRQIGDLDLAADALRAGQAGRAMSERVMERHFETRDDVSFVAATRALHGKVLGSTTTIRHQLAATGLRSAALSPAFMRITRPGARLVRRAIARSRAAAGSAAQVSAAARSLYRDMLSRINSRELRVDPIGPRDGPVTMDTLRGTSLLDRLKRWLRWPRILLVIALLILLLLLLFVPYGWAVTLGVAAALALAILRDERRPERRFANTFTVPEFSAATPSPTFQIAPVQQSWSNAPAPGPAVPVSPQTRARQAREFQTAAGQALELARLPAAPAQVFAPADLGSVRGKLATGLDPAVTIPQMVLAGLVFRDATVRPEDPLDRIWDHPKFPEPMYQPLAQMSQDLILPGLGRVPVNSCGLVATNQHFVEAYMVGLNHEMSRELLWREYPTDQRGSFFRQFWDVTARGTLPPEDSPGRDALRDIRPIHEWRSGNLGAHRPGGPQEENVVLLIRGDLLKKYPNTVVYAAQAGWVETETEIYRAVPEGAEERTPIFRGELPPDTSFVGFKLTEPEVRADPGWFFVLEEQFSQPRFGLDVPNGAPATITRWSGLSWSHFNATPVGGYVPVAAAPAAVTGANVAGGPVWGTSAAALAAITLQQPVRIMVHGSQMIPVASEASNA